MFRKRNSRSISSEKAKLHSKEISLFTAISKRYVQAKKENKISDK